MSNLDEMELPDSSDNNRMLLKEQRKLRNKQKREIKKLERQKEKENKAAMFRLQPQGSNVSIITRDFADQLLHTQIPRMNCNSLLKYEDFPALGTKCKKHLVSHIEDNQGVNINVGNKLKKKNDVIKIDMIELISADRKMTYTLNEPTPSVSCTEHYKGNILDSTLPKRMEGKHRETPKFKKPTKLKRSIIYDGEVFEKLNINVDDNGDEIKDSDDKILYFDNVISQDLTDIVQVFIKDLVGLQEKLYKRNQLKGKIKRRYVVGFSEVQKHLNLNKVKLVIITTDIKITNANDSLSSMIHKIVNLAASKDVPHVFALKRRLLGRLTLKFIPVSCIGITNYSNLENQFHVLLENINEAKKRFKENQTDSAEKDRQKIDDINLPLLENLKIALHEESVHA